MQATEVTAGYDGCMMAGQRGVPLTSNEARQQFLWDVSVFTPSPCRAA